MASVTASESVGDPLLDFVQLVNNVPYPVPYPCIGEPGTGKSALLKAVAEEAAQTGPVFVLKDGRIHPRGWSAHAHTLKVRDDIATLLCELACSSIPVLFIDGIDKIVDPAIQLTVNDILRALTQHDHLSDWRVLTTVREQNLKHIETWLDQGVLKKLPLRTVTVGALNQEELSVVATEVPRLRPLLVQPGSLDVVLSRPFFLDAITGLAGNSSSQLLPATEVELLSLWWRLGGSDRSDFSPAQHRRTVLLDFAQRLAQAPNVAIPIRNVAPDPLGELKTAGVLRDKEFGHSVEFTHDIYEEWALCELLIGEQDRLAAYLQDVGQPQVLVRPTQLLGTYVLETTGSTETWKALLEKTGESSLRPVWQRAILTSCFQSTRTAELLGKLSADLMQGDGELLRRLLLAISTLEVIPNPLFLNEQLVPDLEPDERAQLAHYAALPKPLTWIRFLDWLVPQTRNLQPNLIPALLPVLATWQNNYAGNGIRHCREIGTLSYDWLLEIEDALHPDSWKNLRRPFGFDTRYQDERNLEKGIRSLFLSSAGDVPDLVTKYLREKASDKRNRHQFRENIVTNSAALIRYLPIELVDFILGAFLEHPQDHQDRWGSYDNHLMRELGIGGHHQFYPASPIQIPFLALLRQNEEQGLRLIHGLCNHSVSTWCWACSRRSYHSPVTPLPIHIKFRWGRQSFWGDNQVYLWFRGYWGNDAVKSALMALELWAIEKIDGGAEFDDIFQKVIQGNNSVAALGIGVSLCLAYPAKATASSVPLVTSPYLWEWDIRRLVQDSSGLPANEIGNWYQHRVQLSAVRKLNQKAHRKQDIRALTLNLLFSSDKGLRRTYLRGIRSFPKRLPFVYAEEEKIPEHVTAVQEKMKLFAEQGDPKHLKTKSTDDGKHVQFWIEPPSLKQPKYQAQQKEHERLNQYSGLALWARKSLEDGKLDEHLTVEDAISKGKEFDDESLFDLRLGPDNFLKSQQAAAVSGAAFVAARYSSDAAWSDEIGAWCLHVLERAATAPEQADSVSYRGSLLTMHPAVFATHGYAALLARGYKKELCKDAVLNLAVDALEGVVAAVFASTKYYVSTEPKFCWILLDLGLRQCIVPKDTIPNSNSPHWDDQEALAKLALLDRAESSLRSAANVELPNVPMAWIKSGNPTMDDAKSDTAGYKPNDLLFMFNLAEQILFQFPLEPLLVLGATRSEFLRLLDQLLEWTIQEIVPPFARSSRDKLSGDTPFEWVFKFSEWCGKIFTKLTAVECREILKRIVAQDNETALLIMQSLMRSFMIDAFLLSRDIGDDHLLIWSEMTEWVFDNPEWSAAKSSDYLDREFQSCALSVLFCAASGFSPTLCGVERGWRHWPKFLPIIERAVREFGLNKVLFYGVLVLLKGGGFDLLPDPALNWLKDIVVAKKRDQLFWGANGESTVEIIKRLVENGERTLIPEHRDTISLIADILVDNGVRGAGFLQQELLRTNGG